MLLKLGVDISRLKRPMRRALPHIETVFEVKGDEAVITSTFEGNHGEGSLHYADLAVDFRYPKSSLPDMVNALRKRLGDAYDVVLSPQCIHIEYDPKY